MPNPNIGDTGVVPVTRQVNSKTLDNDINISQGDVGLGNVNNTSDMSKPVSTLMQSALDLKGGIPAAWVFTNNASRSIVTAINSANGWQLSSTRTSMVAYTLTTTTNASIAGGSDGYVVLEVCATNSATGSNWQEVARTRNGQALSLAITLQSIQNIATQVMAIVPAGYYVRLRSVNSVGTPTYAFTSGQEVLL